MILGIKWLSQLGVMRCNYREPTLQFNWEGDTILSDKGSKAEWKNTCAQLSTVDGEDCRKL